MDFSGNAATARVAGVGICRAHDHPAMIARSLSIAFVLSGAALAFACSASKDDEGEVDAAALSEEELAREALRIMGAPQVARAEGQQASCSFTGCHSINPLTLNQWNRQYTAAMDFLASNQTQTKKINYFRQNPSDARTGFTPERVGIMAAGAHLALGANVSETRHPETFKQGKLLEQTFRGKEALYGEFRQKMLMPVLPQFPRLTARNYEVILTWFKKGMPHLADIIQEQRPTDCVDNFEPLKAYASEVKGSNWMSQNKSDRVPMFACASVDESPTNCFQQKKDGKDIFPSAANEGFSRTWPLDGSTVRILRELSSPNSYWLRSSADGRFAATGGGREGGAQAIDLRATLDGSSRDIGLEAEYDPDFFPDNKAFMFQGGTKFCAQSLLEKQSTTLVTFAEPECSSLEAASGLYQTVGQRLGDNSIGDRFILYSVWAGDSGSYSATARDTEPRAGEDSGIDIYVAVARGNDVEEGYQVQGEAHHLETPYRGDTMMGRSGRLLGSRVAGETGALGYAIERLEATSTGGGYNFQLASLGKVCMKGNKANFSFDERFLATHHYNEPADFGEADDPEYANKGSSDVFVADFVTGKKQKITKMGPGQFALYAHFRSDGWLYFLVVDHNTDKYYVVASDWAVRQREVTPTP